MRRFWRSQEAASPDTLWSYPVGEVNRIQDVVLTAEQWAGFVSETPLAGPAEDPSALERLRAILLKDIAENDHLGRSFVEAMVPPSKKLPCATLFNVAGPSERDGRTPTGSFIVGGLVAQHTLSLSAQVEAATVMDNVVDLAEWAGAHRRVMHSPQGPETGDAQIIDLFPEQ